MQNSVRKRRKITKQEFTTGTWVNQLTTMNSKEVRDADQARINCWWDDQNSQS
jgi:hypothetical protein